MTLDIIYSLSRREGMQNVEIKIWIFYLNVKRYTNIVRRPLLSNNLYYPAISTFAVQICYTNKFLLYS